MVEVAKLLVIFVAVYAVAAVVIWKTLDVLELLRRLIRKKRGLPN